MDGTNFRINEPTPFSKVWFDKKTRSAGIKYEVAISIRGGDILHIHGPFAGSVHDIEVFRDCLKSKMAPGELCEADKGYIGEGLHIRLPQHAANDAERKIKSRARN